jgi:DNA-directed RNA polymerase subunit H (RpoH/RPB5)
VFTHLELLCNVLEHDLVPHHEALSEREKVQVLSQYNVYPEQIPRIRVSGKRC